MFLPGYIVIDSLGLSDRGGLLITRWYRGVMIGAVGKGLWCYSFSSFSSAVNPSSRSQIGGASLTKPFVRHPELTQETTLYGRQLGRNRRSQIGEASLADTRAPFHLFWVGALLNPVSTLTTP